MQALVDAGDVDDVESGNGEGEGGGFDAAADDDLGFFFQALLRLVGGGKLGGEDLVENCFFGVVGFDGFAAEGAGDEGGLVLELHEQVGEYEIESGLHV